MPELPEVEVLVRSLEPQLKNKTVRQVRVLRPRVLRPTSSAQLSKALVGGKFLELTRRGKYLIFMVGFSGQSEPLMVIGHLGMTGRMYLQPADADLPKHAAVVFDLGSEVFVYEDARYFGRFTLETDAIEKLGPEPLGEEFTVSYLAQALKSSSQPVKVKLLDQTMVAGIGNIYAAEALFRAGISPRLAARRLKRHQIERLWQAIREILAEAIAWGSTIQIDGHGRHATHQLFVLDAEQWEFSTERLRVYGHEGKPCSSCGTLIKRLAQAARSTYYCPGCQH